MRIKVTLVLIAAIIPARTLAGQLTTTGWEPRIWDCDSVVYAEVASVTTAGPPIARVTLHVKSTLTGAYDAAANSTLETDLYYQFPGSEIVKPPAPKARVIAVLRRLEPPPDSLRPVKPYIVIPGDTVTYMPNRTAIVEVSGFDDPKVTQLIKRLRELRTGKRPPWPYVETPKAPKSAAGP